MDPSHDGSNILTLTKNFCFSVCVAGLEEEENQKIEID